MWETLIRVFLPCGITAITLCGCAVPQSPPPQANSVVPAALQRQAQAMAAQPDGRRLKRKIAIGRFSNETRYGRTLLADDSGDPLGKQASDMLAARLVESGAFLVFERPDLDKVRREQTILGEANLIGVDALILGSVTEFGRSTTGEVGFLSATKRQLARAKVEVRLVDPRTAQVFFSASGSGEASSEAGEIAGFGSRANYDATLNDRAIGAAVSDVMNALVTKLDERPWRTDILKVQGRQIFVSGGSRQGLKIGDTLSVMRAGETVKSAQSGFTIALPAAPVATVRVAQFFGDNETNEGAVTELVTGTLAPGRTDALFVTEMRGAN
jgi:curli biogenesis system outer membrane secretion channel CsgG